ncbi:hypothetical protein ES708_25833 [subsurface metagenome]
MEKRLTEKRVGGGIKKEKTATWNGGVEEAGSFKKNGPILYFSVSLDRTRHSKRITPKDIQNRLSALLRTHLPDGLLFLF